MLTYGIKLCLTPMASILAMSCMLTMGHPLKAQEQAKSADGFVGFLGVNTHLTFTQAPYDNYANVKTALVNLGIRHIRDGFVPPATTTYENDINDLANSGIHSNIIVDGNWFPTPYGTTKMTASMLTPSLNALLPGMESVEGTNESNLNSSFKYLNNGFAQGTVNWDQDLYSIVKGDSSISSLPVILSSMGSVSNYNNYLYMSAITPGPVNYADWGNTHCYPGGNLPGYTGTWNPFNIAWSDTACEGTASAPGMTYGKPIATTETGYEMYDDQWSVSERADGLYMPRLMFSHFNAGETRCYEYELFDQPAQAGAEAHFGMLHGDGSAKPAYTAMQNVISILCEPGASFTPGSLSYTMSGASTVQHTLLQKSNGDFYLVLWNEISSYNCSSSGGSDIVNGTTPVTLTFPSDKMFTVYSPNDTTATMPNNYYTASANETSITLNVPDHVLILQIRPEFATGSNKQYLLVNCLNGDYINMQSGFGCTAALPPAYWSQRWLITPTGDGDYYLENYWDGDYINTQSGFECTAYLWAGASSQEWGLWPTGSGSYYLMNKWLGTGINTQSGFECTSVWNGEVSAEWNVYPFYQ